MKLLKIVYMDGYDEVRDLESQNVIFSTKIPDCLIEELDNDIIEPEVIDNVVNIWNESQNINCLGSEGKLDEYLLNESRCSEDEREIIVEALFDYASK
jgi:hypothetical protein